MRKTIAGPVSANRGQTVRFDARLRRGQNYAYIQVFAKHGDGDIAPYVAPHKLQVNRKGEPNAVNPTSIRLTRELRPSHTLELTVDEPAEFYLMQDVDLRTDKTAKGRINCYGTKLGNLIASARGWLARNT